MKKISLILLLTLFLTACVNEEAEPAPVEEKEQVEEVNSEPESSPEVVDTAEETDAAATQEIEQEIEAVEPVEAVEEETEDWDEILTGGMPVQDDGQLTSEEVWLLTEYLAVTENDELVEANINNGHIQIAISLGDNGIFPAAEYAPHLYSKMTDTFLEYGGWNDFTVDFGGFGSITMNRAEAVENEYGVYFPLEVIEGRMR